MAHAEICPACNGNGNRNGACYNATGINEICLVCDGGGWVTVEDVDSWIHPTDQPFQSTISVPRRNEDL